jgi:hypothetical protein
MILYVVAAASVVLYALALAVIVAGVVVVSCEMTCSGPRRGVRSAGVAAGVLAVCGWLGVWWALSGWVDDTGTGPAGPTRGERSAPGHKADAEGYRYLIDWTEADGHGPA